MFVIFGLTVLVLVVGFVENSKLAGFVRFIDSTIKSYKTQVKTIDKLADRRATDDQKATQTYQERAKEIEERRENELSKVNVKKIKNIEKLKDGSTEELAKKLKEEFKL
jgi:Sec-independent protein translocase protein TatA